MFYGAQFIANREGGYVSHYDAARNGNTADALEALKQFDGKKPCWSDATSPSGMWCRWSAERGGCSHEKRAFLEGQRVWCAPFMRMTSVISVRPSSMPPIPCIGGGLSRCNGQGDRDLRMEDVIPMKTYRCRRPCPLKCAA